MNLDWFYSLLVAVIVGGIALEAFLESEKRKRRRR